jgi:hypothetical protein
VIIAAWFVMFLAVLALATYIGAWVYDAKHEYDSPMARRVGMAFALPLTVVFFIVSIVFFDLAHEDEPSTKVTIECEVAENEDLTCEVVG